MLFFQCPSSMECSSSILYAIRQILSSLFFCKMMTGVIRCYAPSRTKILFLDRAFWPDSQASLPAQRPAAPALYGSHSASCSLPGPSRRCTGRTGTSCPEGLSPLNWPDKKVLFWHFSSCHFPAILSIGERQWNPRFASPAKLQLDNT